MRDRDLAKDESIFSIEREMLKFAHRAAQHDLLDILPLPTLNVKKHSGPDSILPVSLKGGNHSVNNEKAKCTCPIKIESKKDKKRNRQRFFIGGTNNNGYEINCPKHGRRTSN